MDVTGLSAFPLTPLRHDRFDATAHARLITRLANAGVDSIGALGSTGSYLYLDRQERRDVARVTVEHAGTTPVLIGIGALRTSQVQALADDAQEAGADGLLLAPASYQALTDDDVYGLYEDVTAGLSVPLIVYDNPGTTHYSFSLEMYARVAALPNVAAIKIPPPNGVTAEERVRAIRTVVPPGVRIGISGDSHAAAALGAGADAWFSVIGGTLPETALTITRAAQGGDPAAARAAADRLQPLWDLFAAHGSLRVTAAIAEHLGLVTRPCLPRPILGLSDRDRGHLARVVDDLDLRA